MSTSLTTMEYIDQIEEVERIRTIMMEEDADEKKYEQAKNVSVPHSLHSLHRTKPCRHVAEGGHCYRAMCTFAHSQAEYRDPPCQNGNRCYSRACQFKHPGETKEQYYRRIGRGPPQCLPPTRYIEPQTLPTEYEPFVIDLSEKHKEHRQPQPQVIRVPVAMFEQTMEMLLVRGMSNLTIETY